jgi:2-dehydropantoate 2-reductase
MKIAVIGAGAIGGLVAGYLKFKGDEVSLIGRDEAVSAIRKNGLHISGTRGNIRVNIEVSDCLSEAPELAILTVKTQDCDKAIRENLRLLKHSYVLTTQNGVQADALVARHINPHQVISSIIMFGSTYLEPGKIVHNFEGPWVIGAYRDLPSEKLAEVRTLLSKSFPIVVSDNITASKYLKIFINASNCIPAILGVSIQEAFSDLEISRISVAIWKEGLEVVKKARVELAPLPDFPVERVSRLTAMHPQEAAKIFSNMMTNLSLEPLYGSILQSIKRNRPSEIDYINGEFLKLARRHKTDAPLNKKLVEMVHEVEKSGKFFTKFQLLSAVREFL